GTNTCPQHDTQGLGVGEHTGTDEADGDHHGGAGGLGQDRGNDASKHAGHPAAGEADQGLTHRFACEAAQTLAPQTHPQQKQADTACYINDYSSTINRTTPYVYPTKKTPRERNGGVIETCLNRSLSDAHLLVQVGWESGAKG